MPVSIDGALTAKRSPTESAKRLALLKASAIAVHFPECLVIGADTLVVVDGTVLGKPHDRHEALKC
jgi:septum formation protein